MSSWFSTLALSWRVAHSGLFNARHYKLQNADIKNFPALLHWSRFYHVENRQFGYSSLSTWLLPEIVTRRISPHNARRLKSLQHDFSALEAYSAELGLNINDYRYFQAISDGEFVKAYSYLEQTSPETTFEGIYTFASRHMKLDKLKLACNWAASNENLELKQAVKAYEMARAIDQNVIKSAQQVLSSLNAYPEKQKKQAQFFIANLPVINTGSNVYKSLTMAGLQSVDRQMPGRLGKLAREVGVLAELVNIATYNALFSDPLCLDTDTGKAIPLKEGVKKNKKCLKLRLLTPNYWAASQTPDCVAESVLRFHKKMIFEKFENKTLICPIIATHIFDITDEQNWGLDTLSYHTIIRETKPESYTHYKESYLPGYFSLDHKGYSGWSSLATISAGHFNADFQKAEIFHKVLYTDYVDLRVSKYPQNPKMTEAVNKTHLPKVPYFFAALQVPDDSVAYWQHMPVAKWLKHLCEYTQKLDISVVIKVHPMDKTEATQVLLRTFKHMAHVHISTASIHDLIVGALGVVTVNSGVGFEALLHHKPVITCGSSDYSAVTIEAKSKTDLSEAIKIISTKDYTLTPTKINAFLYVYCHEHCIYMPK